MKVTNTYTISISYHIFVGLQIKNEIFYIYTLLFHQTVTVTNNRQLQYL